MNLQENEDGVIDDDVLGTSGEDDGDEEGSFDDTGNFPTGEHDNLSNDDFSETSGDDNDSANDGYSEPQQKTPSDFRVMRFEDFVSSRAEG